MVSVCRMPLRKCWMRRAGPGTQCLWHQHRGFVRCYTKADNDGLGSTWTQVMEWSGAVGQPEEGGQAGLGKGVSVSERSHLRITKAKLSLWSWGGWESRSLLARRCGRSGCVLEGSFLGKHVRRGVRPPTVPFRPLHGGGCPWRRRGRAGAGEKGGQEP